MKKLFALLLSLGAMTAVFAQGGYGRNESRDVILGQQNRTIYDNNPRNDNGNYSTRDRDVQIERINREYDWKIQAVKRDRYLKNGEKKRQIRALENERNARIREAQDRFYDGAYKRNDRRH